MDILSDKIVKTRKPHKCGACSRMFPAGTMMRTVTGIYDGIDTWRECPTCQILLSKFPEKFDNGFREFDVDCVDIELQEDQTPEQLLEELSTLYVLETDSGTTIVDRDLAIEIDNEMQRIVIGEKIELLKEP